MGERHEKLGIKQTIQKHWMDKTVRMLLAGMPEVEIRAQLRTLVEAQKPGNGAERRGTASAGMTVAILAAWFAPEEELRAFRDDALQLARNAPPEGWLPLHWAVLSAAYPFWFHTAKVCGRLFKLQDRITQRQIFDRLREQYGDRESVTRYARYAVRSFVAWGVLKDSETKGCYDKAAPVDITDPAMAAALCESALLALPEGKSDLALLLNHPALFPFRLPAMSGDAIVRHSGRIESSRYGLNEELLMLRGR